MRLIADPDQSFDHLGHPEDGPERRVKAAARKRGKPSGVHGRISDEELRELHVLHVEGLSIRTLGHRVWRGRYSSPQSAAMAISAGFRRLRLWRRPRQEATALVQREHRHPDSPGKSNTAAYRRWLLEKAGRRRRCEALTVSGTPCRLWAMNDSECCHMHDPRNAEKIAGHLAEMRKRARPRVHSFSDVGRTA